MIELRNGKEELTKILNENPKVIIDFHTVWCGPCKMLAPELEKFEKNHPEWKLVKVDAERFPDVFRMAKADAVPTVCIMNGTKIVEIITGFRPLVELEKIILKH